MGAASRPHAKGYGDRSLGGPSRAASSTQARSSARIAIHCVECLALNPEAPLAR
jgi:hypothetical protein